MSGYDQAERTRSIQVIDKASFTRPVASDGDCNKFSGTVSTGAAWATEEADHEHGPETRCRHRRARSGACEHEHCRDEGDADSGDDRRHDREPRPDRSGPVGRLWLAWLWLARRR